LLLRLGILILQLFVKLVVIIVPELFIQPQFFFLQVIFLILSSFPQLKLFILLQLEL
jgi:hypothetical protein